MTIDCPNCNGTGEVYSGFYIYRCPECQGYGEVKVDEMVDEDEEEEDGK